jgi:OmpA-OmpF porin, OOP family
MNLKGLIAGLTACCASISAYAQTGTGQAAPGSYSWIPYTTSGYVGINLGRSDFKADCIVLYSCDSKSTAAKVYTGGLLQENIGLEVAYVNFGRVDRFGGNQRAYGLNLNLVGNIPMADAFHLTGRLGTTYSWSRTTAAAELPTATGRDKGFGLAYGVGVGYDVNPTNQVSLEWERHRVPFATAKQDIDMLSVGWKLKF